MKELIKNKYISIHLITGFVLGVGYNDEIISLMIGPFSLDIKTCMFNPKYNKPKNVKYTFKSTNKPGKPQSI